MRIGQKKYWDRNLANWADLYLDASHGHEHFDRPQWFTSLYQTTIGRIERRLMRDRYLMTTNFIRSYLEPGMTFADLGCGTGIFVVEALKQEPSLVHAIDFSESAIAATRVAAGGAVRYHLGDLQRADLPKADVAICMGVTPYLDDIAGFVSRATIKTKLLMIHYVDPNNVFNRIREALPVLNVRELKMIYRNEVDRIYDTVGAALISRYKLGTGYIDIVAGPHCSENEVRDLYLASLVGSIGIR